MAAPLSAEFAQLKQQHEAEAARNHLLQAEVNRLATQIEQQQRSLEALRALAQAAKQTPPAPAPSRPAATAETRPSSRDSEAGRLTVAFAQLKQRDAAVATNRRLQPEVDRLASQTEHQQKSREGLGPKLASAKQTSPAPTPAASSQTLSSFNAVQGIITRLRHEQTPSRVTPSPHDLQPPAPMPSAPVTTAQFRPQAHLSSPWLELMNARMALRAGDSFSSIQRLEAAKSELLSQPSPRHFFAANQISMAVALINARRNIPAFYFVDLAIANAGSAVPYAAENMLHLPGPYAP